ncbi:hypothetical protein [Streptomyces griseorubiginosus]|uniref:hypothetical protein n=1 Tax=Streptomyces griseorubiginosus TaxID=67304 RepID=UPI001AD7BB3D|nr:hypothetical protein [Streptomyces griseorubiginosus]MBO4260584.1 hypothetical protein [Streptomyces griseorubiginosus]
MMAIQYFWRHPLAEQVREEGRKEGREQGRIEARREVVLHVLELRRIPVPDSVRERVEECTDLAQLESWAKRALHGADIEELFADE